ncbi:hypothetical protein D623_10007381 [Myotis brandtii]|uniref:Uncharacterized protein n=1 Tax=Myotis brandtii TaxID=109478 RepID=S7QBW4_MYOBR|nr:hypothetical protein D623_10007381 [Myotis brandtii]
MGQCCCTCCAFSHLRMQCMWKQWEHWPHTSGQSSPGTLPAGTGEVRSHRARGSRRGRGRDPRTLGVGAQGGQGLSEKTIAGVTPDSVGRHPRVSPTQ